LFKHKAWLINHLSIPAMRGSSIFHQACRGIKALTYGKKAIYPLTLQESSKLPTAFDPRHIGLCRRRIIRRGQPSAYLLGVDLPRRTRLDPRRIGGPRRTSAMPTAKRTLGILTLGVGRHGGRQVQRRTEIRRRPRPSA
jgi:hypothetical protein